MAWQAVLASGITATAGLGGNILANRYAKKQLERQNAFNREMWELDNEYNSPENQMARLKAAGLNPNLVYGNGSVANTSKGPVRGGDFTAVPSPTGDLGRVAADTLMMYQDVQMRQAQTDNIRAQTENVRARTLTEGANLTLKNVVGAKTQEELRQLEGLWNFNVQAKDEEAKQAAIRTDQMLTQLMTMSHEEIGKRLDNEYKRANLTSQQIQQERDRAALLFQTMQNDWMKLGVTTSDNPILRVVVRMMNEAGIRTWDDLVTAVKSLFR